MRLRSHSRLRRSKDFDLIRRRADKADCSAFVLYLTRTAEGGGAFSRFGVVAGKKLGGAPQRNRLKRIFREIFRLNQDKLPHPCDILIFPRRAALEKEFSFLQQRYVRAALELAARKPKE